MTTPGASTVVGASVEAGAAGAAGAVGVVGAVALPNMMRAESASLGSSRSERPTLSPRGLVDLVDLVDGSATQGQKVTGSPGEASFGRRRRPPATYCSVESVCVHGSRMGEL
jgi:hypothetical protein